MPDNRATAPILIACAVPAEAKAVARGLGARFPDDARAWVPIALTDRAHLLITGVGKANASGAVARALSLDAYSGVWSVGVAGALPGSQLELGDLALATASLFADEGVETPDGFATIDEVGFPTTEGLDAVLLDGHGSLKGTAPLPSVIADRATARGPIATVSTGAGTDARARNVAQRTGAIAEAMEGAAIALAGARLGVPFAEIRAISNTTGNRDSQQWDLRTALDAIASAFDAAL